MNAIFTVLDGTATTEVTSEQSTVLSHQSDTVSCTFTYHTSSHGSSSSSQSPLAYSLTRSVFHSELKTWLFRKSFPP